MTAFSERDSRSKGPVGSNMNVYVLVMNLKIRLTKLGISPDNDWNCVRKTRRTSNDDTVID